MTPEHFCDIQSRRDFFRNCAGGIGTIAAASTMSIPLLLATSCSTSNTRVSSADISHWKPDEVVAKPLTDESTIALITRFLDATTPANRKSIVSRETISFENHLFGGVSEIWRRTVDGFHIDGYNARPLIDSFICSNLERYIIGIESDPSKPYEFGKWIGFELYEKGYCSIEISLPVMDANNNVGLISYASSFGMRAGSENIVAFKFNDGKYEELARINMWMS